MTCQMRILFFTKYPKMGASSRYRSFQYEAYFEFQSGQCVYNSLYDDEYLNSLYRGQRSLVSVLRAYSYRLFKIFSSKQFDIIVVEKELFPYFPGFIERIFYRFLGPFVVDYDDAIFHLYDQHRLDLVRFFLKRKIATVMRFAQAVIVGNDYLASYAKSSGARDVKILPTVVDLTKYPLKTKVKRTDGRFTIGWIGSPTTTKYLLNIAPALQKVCEGGMVKIQLIGATELDLPGVDVEYLEWSEGTEVEHMRAFDVGIMPLPDEPWAKGKCGFKLIQYMACCLPVVASPVGANRTIVSSGQNGFLVNSINEWVDALLLLKENPEMRQQLGQNGRKLVEEKYCLSVTAPKYMDILRRVVSCD